MEVRDENSRLPPLVWENVVLPRRIRRADVLLSSSFTMPVLAPTPPTVLLVYDALQALRPTDFGARGRLVFPFMRASIRRADIIVTISEAARDDIVRGFGVDPARLEIVPGGVDEQFRPLADPDADRVRRAVGLDERPYLLFVGKLSKRRNVPAIIEAAGMLRKRGFPHVLVLAGYNTTGLPLTDLAQRAGAELVHVEGVGDDLLVDLYNGADVFVQAPLHETYSLPLIEAMACGTPAVTSGEPALREIGGDAATYIEEPTPTAIANAIGSLLNDAARRAESRQIGLHRASSLRWPQRAAALAALCVRASQR